MIMQNNIEQVVVGGPHLFLVSLGQGKFLDTLAVNAQTWQDACVRAAVELLNLEGMSALMRVQPAPEEWVAKFPTIASLQELLWEDKVSLHIAMVRPEIEAINTGYEESEDGPLSRTVTSVRVRILKLDVGTVYVK